MSTNPSNGEAGPELDHHCAWWRSSNGNIFSVTDLLCGEFTGHRWIRPVTRSLGVFYDMLLNKRLSKHSWSRWLETPIRSLWRHCNGLQTLYQPRVVVGYQRVRWWLPNMISLKVWFALKDFECFRTGQRTFRKMIPQTLWNLSDVAMRNVNEILIIWSLM